MAITKFNYCACYRYNMIQAKDRIRELTQRQIYYGSSMFVKLNAVKGRFFYKVWAWIGEKQFVVIQGKYNGEDPEDLFNKALMELNLKKIKVGVPKT